MGPSVELDHRGPPAIRIRMLGPLAVERDGAPVALPASRKACGLLAYLALTRRPVSRSRLCALLWDEAANDPRGELRWCLSKLRGVLGDEGAFVARDDAVALNMDEWFVDARALGEVFDEGVEFLDAERLQALCDLYDGELLEGLVIDRCPEFNLWLTAQPDPLRGASRRAAPSPCRAPSGGIGPGSHGA